MLRYVHHPEIQRLEYNPIDEQESSATSDMLQTLRRLHQQILMQQRQIGDIVVPTAKNSMGQRTSRTQRAPAWLDQLTKLHSKATHIYEELGAWAADHFISQTVELFKAKADLTTSFSYLPSPGDRTRSRLLQILDQADFTQPVKALSVLCPISTKVEQLLAYLERQDSRECSGLIFVQQRATVSVLCAILSTHPRIEGRFRCATFVGQSSSAQKQYNISEIFDYRAQKETMAAFRSGKRNLVIATDALEEGIDIAACNLVVCFNLPPSLKSFIQRRGRARMERSKFAIMLPNNSDRSKIDAWKELEKELIRAYQDEQRARIQAASIEQQEEVVDYRLQVKTTGYVILGTFRAVI
jgi:ERCC4-related helicase